jgi:hypothetical protein
VTTDRHDERFKRGITSRPGDPTWPDTIYVRNEDLAVGDVVVDVALSRIRGSLVAEQVLALAPYEGVNADICCAVATMAGTRGSYGISVERDRHEYVVTNGSAG